MISDAKIIEIFCNLDDFMKEFDTVLTKNGISDASQSKRRNKKSKMSRNNLTLHLNRIFIKHTGKKIGSSILRHIQSSELNKDRISLLEQQKQIKSVEDKFLHSSLMNQLYRKID